MTSTLARPESATARPAVDQLRAAALAGLVAGLAGAAGGVILAGGVAVLVWIPDGSGDAVGALRVGAMAWLLGNGSGLEAAGTPIGAIPLGVLALAAIGLVAVAHRTCLAFGVAPRARTTAVVGGTCAVAYAGALALLAVWSATGPAHVDPLRAAVAGGLVGLVCGTAGAALATGVAGRWAAALPASARSAVRGGVIGAGALVLCGLLVVVGGLVVNLDAAVALWDGLSPGALGGAGLLVVCAAVLPNLVLWAVAMLLGPGFAAGSGTSVTLGASTLGPLPALPVLAWIPAEGERPGWFVVLGCLPLLAGALAGFLAARRHPTDPMGALAVGAGAGAFAGTLVAAATTLSGGAVGPGRLADTGPDLLLAGSLAIGVLAVGGALGGAFGHYRGPRGGHDAAVEPRRDDRTGPAADGGSDAGRESGERVGRPDDASDG
ncbi:DUF6350 family protein [Mumia flava]|nr:DUF6350 family protein [Mumia flava]